jgi:hypothetical protein
MLEMHMQPTKEVIESNGYRIIHTWILASLSTIMGFTAPIADFSLSGVACQHKCTQL